MENYSSIKHAKQDSIQRTSNEMINFDIEDLKLLLSTNLISEVELTKILFEKDSFELLFELSEKNLISPNGGFCAACITNNYEKVLEYVNKYGKRLNYDEGLYFASENDNLEIVKYLLGVNASNFEWRYYAYDVSGALKIAILANAKNVIEFLLSREDLKDVDNLMAIFAARGEYEYINKLDHYNASYEKAAIAAIYNGYDITFLKMVEKGAKNVEDMLKIAIAARRSSVVEFLLKKENLKKETINNLLERTKKEYIEEYDRRCNENVRLTLEKFIN